MTGMISVTCAIIRNEEDEILVVQKDENTDHPLKWEFPGGKLHENETEESCIVREIQEELAIDIVICKRLPVVDFDYGLKQIRLIPFICDTLDDIPFLTEHKAFKWVDTEKLTQIDFSEADIIVAEEYLNELGLQNSSEMKDQVPVRQTFNENDLRSMVENMMRSKEAEWVAESAIENEQILDKLLEYSFSDDKKLAFRASWTLSKVIDRHPDLVEGSLSRMIEALDKLENESVQRSFLRIISMSDFSKITGKHHGILADHCFKMLRSGTSAIAIKAYSMEVIYKLALIYPELANELSATIRMLESERSAGILARGHIILKKLAGSIKDL